MDLSVFDWKNPDYDDIFDQRMRALERIRSLPGAGLAELKAYYKENPADFIDDWGVTFDPRLVERGLPSLIPMILFPKQRELIDAMLRKWKEGRPLLVEKSRDCGASYTAIELCCTLGLFYEGFSAGFGSRKAEYVDKSGQPKSLFYKGRVFMRNIPVEFRGGYEEWRDAPHMRISFPETGAVITGEAGDQIGRGDRASIYVVDESAFLENPESIEHSLSQTTNCRIDISSVNGMNNPFAKKRHEGKIELFIFDWRDDPRKDEEWYKRQQEDLDPVTIAQEIDRDYTASVEGILIPGAWAKAAIDAHVKLGIKPTGEKMVSLDVADEGRDDNATCCAHGVVVEDVREFSGKGSDIFKTVERAIETCDDYGAATLRYDADGLGAGVRGDARIINERRVANDQRAISVEGFRGSEAVYRPESEDVPKRKNKDFFANRKAQAGWSLRTRFQKTYRWIVEGVECDPDDIISFSSKIPNLYQVLAEMSQPTYATNAVGKIVIDKTPDGMPSPNRYDSVMIRFAPMSSPLVIPEEAMRRAGAKRAGGVLGRMPARRRFRL